MPQPDTRSGTAPARGLNLALWVAQVLLFAGFAISGVMKVWMPIVELAAWAPWTADVAPAFVRFVGLVEILGAVGVLLPAITRVQPGVTPLAALGLAIMMLLALAFHLLRGDELAALAAPLLLGALAMFVAWGRARRVPIARR